MEMKEIYAGKIHIRTASAGLETGINRHQRSYQSLFHRFLLWTFPCSAECVHAWVSFRLFLYKTNYVCELTKENVT